MKEKRTAKKNRNYCSQRSCLISGSDCWNSFDPERIKSADI